MRIWSGCASVRAAARSARAQEWQMRVRAPDHAMRSSLLRDSLFRVMRLRGSPVSMACARLPRAFRCEVGLDWRGANRRLVLDAGEVLVFVAMHLQRGKELRVVVFHREAEMRSLVVLYHLAIVAAVNSRRARHSAGVARELPDSDRARARARSAVEARLDMRERHQLGRESGVAEDALHRRHVIAAAQQPVVELLA